MGEVISFLVGATGVEDLVARVGVGVMSVGVGVNVVAPLIGTTWMGVAKGVDADDLTTEEMFTEIEAEVTAVALKEFELGIIAGAKAGAAAEVGVEVGAGAGVVVEVGAGLEVAVAAIAGALVHVGVAAVAVAAATEVIAAAVAVVAAMIGMTGQINRFLIRRISGHLKLELLLILKCLLYLLAPKGILLLWELQNIWSSSYLLLGVLSRIIQRL